MDTHTINKAYLEDVQSAPARHAVDIDKVGIKNVRTPLMVRDLANGEQHTIAEVEMGVDLPAAFKGTHMSRFLEALEFWRLSSEERLDYASLKRLLENVRTKLCAQKAFIRFKFPYFVNKQAPVSKAVAPVVYDCMFTGEWHENWEKPKFIVQITVPVTTVCPCSKAISVAGAHGQRTHIVLQFEVQRFTWMEEFIQMAEDSGSAPIYSILKREDEKAVTELAYDQAYFVEDVVRNIATKLSAHPDITWYKVDVESFESIHGHNAFASIEYK